MFTLRGAVFWLQDEVQSEYLDPTKVSLHVKILYRHALEGASGVQSAEDDPRIVTEHVFVIPDDGIQDHDAVHKVQQIINNYMRKDVSPSSCHDA